MVRPQSPDTSLALEERLFERYRQMSPEEKLEHISALGRLAEEVALAGLRAKYPEASDAENRLRLVSRWIDRDTMIRLYDWDPEERGS
jgi:deoxyribodipyrimidine photolyase-like uncharacterized protein